MKYLLITIIAFLVLSSCEKNGSNDRIPTAVKTIAFGDHPLQKFDLYTPKNSDSETKVVIMVHGGGWVMGYHPDEKVTTFEGRYGWDLLNPLLDEGFACVVMKYRTACYNTVPETFNNDVTFYLNRMIEDIDLTIDFLKANAGSFNISDSHFQLVGESAGGHIVMAYGIREISDPDLKSVVPMFGPTNLDAQDFKEIINAVPLLLAEPPNYLLKRANNCESVTNQQVRTLSSLKSFADHNDISVSSPNSFLDTISTTNDFNLGRNIPMFITHGDEDPLVPKSQAIAMAQAMQSKFQESDCAENSFNCHLKLKLYSKCGHGWTGPNCNKNQIMKDIVNWLDSH